MSGTVDKPEHVGKDVKETWTILSREIDGKNSPTLFRDCARKSGPRGAVL